MCVYGHLTLYCFSFTFFKIKRGHFWPHVENIINHISILGNAQPLRFQRVARSLAGWCWLLTCSRALSRSCLLCSVFSRIVLQRWLRFSSLFCRPRASSPALESMRSLPALFTASTVVLWASTSFCNTYRMERNDNAWDVRDVWVVLWLSDRIMSSFSLWRTWCFASSISMALGSPQAFLCSLSSSSVWVSQARSSSKACWNCPRANSAPSSLCYKRSGHTAVIV